MEKFSIYSCDSSGNVLICEHFVGIQFLFPVFLWHTYSMHGYLKIKKIFIGPRSRTQRFAWPCRRFPAQKWVRMGVEIFRCENRQWPCICLPWWVIDITDQRPQDWGVLGSAYFHWNIGHMDQYLDYKKKRLEKVFTAGGCVLQNPVGKRMQMLLKCMWQVENVGGQWWQQMGLEL